jgi:3-methyladenine DNA glycosylase Tag
MEDLRRQAAKAQTSEAKIARPKDKLKEAAYDAQRTLTLQKEHD